MIVGLVVSSSTVFAEEKAALGIGNLALKVDFISFTENDLEDADAGLYLGIEGYPRVLPSLYLGLEAGYANPDDDVELAYVPWN